MLPASRRLAGILFILYPTVIWGGFSLLQLIIGHDPGYLDNPVRQNLWRAGHAHAGVLLMLSLVVLRYVDEANLAPWFKVFVRHGAPVAAIFVPAAFFLSILSPSATRPNGLIILAPIGAVILALTLLVLGIGLLRKPSSA